MTLQQKSTKNISFLKEQINHENKAQSEQNLSDTELDAIRSSDVKILNPSLCKQDSIKNSKDTLESDRLFTELGAAGSLLNRNWDYQIFRHQGGRIPTPAQVHFKRRKVFCFDQRQIPSCFMIYIAKYCRRYSTNPVISVHMSILYSLHTCSSINLVRRMQWFMLPAKYKSK